MDRRRKIICRFCKRKSMIKNLIEETEKTAGRYYNDYFCPYCSNQIGYETLDCIKNYAVIESSFGLTDLQKRVLRIVRRIPK